MRSRNDFNSHAPVADPLMNDATRDKHAGMSRMHKDEHVIIIAPVGQDAEAMAVALDTEGFETQICHGLDENFRQFMDSAGALLMTEEALESAQGSLLLDALKARSEEHTSELQSPCNLVCRLLLEKKKHTADDHRDRLCSVD